MKKLIRIILPKIKIAICLVLCIAIFIAVPCIYFSRTKSEATANEKIVLKIWQIDSFEGGKGSRVDFLQSIGNDFAEKGKCYISVASVSAEAARINLESGNIPDIISYGAGMYGIENYVKEYKCWCHGGYCLLSLDTTTDFSDINENNTVINEGKDNFAGVAALFLGIPQAKFEKSTSAYVSLINGKFKYLLGTQRDIFRLKTRKQNFVVKPLTEFNDLYQNISVTASGDRYYMAKKFCDYLMSRTGEVNKVGMLNNKSGLYDDEMRIMEGLTYDFRLTSPINEAVNKKINQAVLTYDINMLKNLLK